MAYAGKSADSRHSGAAPNQGRSRSLAPVRRGDRSAYAIATGVAIGLIAGVTVALLFAPQSGSETRRDVRRRLRKVRRRGHDAWTDLRDELDRARLALNRARRRRRRHRAERDPELSTL